MFGAARRASYTAEGSRPPHTGCGCGFCQHMATLVNAYLKWCGAGFKIPRLQEEKRILQTLTPDHISRPLNDTPKHFSQIRAHLASLLILDCGLRVGELVKLTRQDIDLDNLLCRLSGKGRKERLVPFSLYLRPILYRYLQRYGIGSHLLATRQGQPLEIRNLQRDLKILGERALISGTSAQSQPN